MPRSTTNAPAAEKPPARPGDFVDYDRYGGVSIDIAGWLSTKAGQEQLDKLRDLSKSSDRTPPPSANRKLREEQL